MIKMDIDYQLANMGSWNELKFTRSQSWRIEIGGKAKIKIFKELLSELRQF